MPVGDSDLELARIERERVDREGLRAYSRMTWPIVRSDPLVASWAWDAVCDHLEAFYFGALGTPGLVVELPPGTSKSSLASVLFTTWVWSQDPFVRFMCASFDDLLIRQNALDAQAIVDSEWHQNRWDVRIDRSKGRVETAKLYYTTEQGMRFSTTVGGKATGWHPDIHIVDDPIKPRDAMRSARSATSGTMSVNTQLREVNQWWSKTMGSRARHAGTLRRLVVMQRLDTADLAGQCREKGYHVLSIPMEYGSGVSHFAFSHPDFDGLADAYPDRPDLVPLREDPRSEQGELIDEERFSKVAMAETRERLGDSAFETQYNQNARPKDGGIFKQDTIMRWVVAPNSRVQIQSWDFKFTSEQSGSMVVGQVWALGSDHQTGKVGYYLLDEVRDWWSFRATLDQVRRLSLKWPNATGKLIENKANGPGIVSMLETELDGLVLMNPQGSKTERAQAVSPLYDACNVWVPARNTWSSSTPEAHIDELVAFPLGAYDDRVDAATQALLYLKTKHSSRYQSQLSELAAMYPNL